MSQRHQWRYHFLCVQVTTWRLPWQRRRHKVSPFADQVLSKAGCSFTIKASVTNKVTRQKQELPESSIFHKIVFSFSTFIHVTSRQPCCAGFSSEAGRELQDFTFSATAASKSPLRTQSPALIPLPHS